MKHNKTGERYASKAAPLTTRRSTRKMKTLTVLIAILVGCGCAAHVSITDHKVDGQPYEAYTSIDVSGSSGALERRAAVLLAELIGDAEADAMTWRKLFAIHDTLLTRGYFIERAFVLPNVPFDRKRRKELGEHLQTEGVAPGSPASTIKIRPRDEDSRQDTVMAVIVYDRKSNLEKWEALLKTIDNEVRVEPSVAH